MSKQILIIAIATLVTVLVWVTADILHSRSQIRIPKEVESVLEPISPQLDQSAIDML